VKCLQIVIRMILLAYHCFRRVEEPIYPVLFFKPTGTFQLYGHAYMTYIKTLLRDSGLSTIADLSLFGVIFATLLESTSTLPLSRRRAKKKKITM